jgi:hypothetical protein
VEEPFSIPCHEKPDPPEEKPFCARDSGEGIEEIGRVSCGKAKPDCEAGEKPWRPKVGEWVWYIGRNKEAHMPWKCAYHFYDDLWDFVNDSKITNGSAYLEDIRPLRLSEVETEEQAKQFIGKKVDLRSGGWGTIIGLKIADPPCWYVRIGTMGGPLFTYLRSEELTLLDEGGKPEPD